MHKPVLQNIVLRTSSGEFKTALRTLYDSEQMLLRYGEKKFSTSPHLKKYRELYWAAIFALILSESNKVPYWIAPTEGGLDFYLGHFNPSQKKFLGSPCELVFITAEALKGSGKDIYENIAIWLKDKKLTNRSALQHEHLVCKIHFDQKGFKLDRLREEVRKLNPATGAIWIFSQTDPQGGSFEAIELFPNSGRASIILNKDIPNTILPMYLDVEKTLKDQGLTWSQIAKDFALVRWR